MRPIAQVSNLCEAFANNFSGNIKQLSKMIQSGGYFSRILGPLLKVG